MAAYMIVSPDPRQVVQWGIGAGFHFGVKFGDGTDHKSDYMHSNPFFMFEENPGVDGQYYDVIDDYYQQKEKNFGKYLEYRFLKFFPMAHAGEAQTNEFHLVQADPAQNYTNTQLAADLIALLNYFKDMDMHDYLDVQDSDHTFYRFANMVDAVLNKCRIPT